MVWWIYSAKKEEKRKKIKNPLRPNQMVVMNKKILKKKDKKWWLCTNLPQVRKSSPLPLFEIRGVKTGYPVRDGLAHVGLGLFRIGRKNARMINEHKYSCPSSALCGTRAFGPTQLIKKINFKNKNNLKLFTPHIFFFRQLHVEFLKLWLYDP